MLLVFGLALLGPTCFTPFVYAQKFATVAPRLPRWAWSGIGAAIAWPLIAIGAPQRTDLVFGLLGAAMAPVVGALAADYVRCRGAWPGPRRGVNLAGVAAWVVGLVVGLLPYLGSATGSTRLRNLQPAAVLAFVAAFLTYALLASVGLQPPPLEVPAASVEPPAAAPQPAEEQQA
jgi:cytosine permease